MPSKTQKLLGIPQDLKKIIDKRYKARGYKNRVEYLRDLIQNDCNQH